MLHVTSSLPIACAAQLVLLHVSSQQTSYTHAAPSHKQRCAASASDVAQNTAITNNMQNTTSLAEKHAAESLVHHAGRLAYYHTTGHIHSCMVSFWPWQCKWPDSKATVQHGGCRSHKDLVKEAAPHYKKARKFYDVLAAQLVQQGHALDVFACSLDQVCSLLPCHNLKLCRPALQHTSCCELLLPWSTLLVCWRQ